MAAFLVEAYQPRSQVKELAALVRRAGLIARAMSDGSRVRHVRTTFVPEDEICFHLFEASSSEAVAAVCREAGLAFDRVTEAVEPIPYEGEMR